MERTLEGHVSQVLVGLQPLLPTLQAKQASIDGHYLLTTPRSAVSVTFEGFEGDRHAGMTRLADGRTPFYPRGTEIRNSRQVSLVSVEELGALARALEIPTVCPEWLGANLALSGVPSLSRIPPGTRMFFPQDAVLVIEGENHPCIYPGKAIAHYNPDRPNLVQAFPKAALHCRGLVAWVERPGSIQQADTLRIQVPSQVEYNF
ncbi:MAG: MOSC domain-containing protein [Chloroflexota bacterium]|nr:MOSC domain-containing protein [Chloroflexota bacterium]